ncbi:hypothetical protein QZH41_011114 [Actinostola sp. cb2023]|nr:hypothetical protein QZH41_011114 [Actinostola sp. cb2023]
MQDYPTLGITSMQDRRQMFHLIQNVKEKENLTRPSLSTGHSFAKKRTKEMSKQESQSDKEPIQTPTQPKMLSALRNPKVRTPNMQTFSYGIPSSKSKPSITKSKTMNGNSNIKVCVRKRPLGNDETESGETDVVNVVVDNNAVVINAPKVAVDLTKYMQRFSFVFDEVFDENFSNRQVYEKTAKPLVNAIFNELFARENASHQVCIVGLTEKQVNNVEELMEVIESGENSRSTGSTGVNADSSRSHAVLQLDLKQQQEGETLGRFSFIDLAGSERAADVTDSDKQTRMEGAEINQSLLALKECIRSLDQDSRHTPFRQSKLTQVLKDSFVGNTRTCMIANVSPCLLSCENTLNTLRYADRYV